MKRIVLACLVVLLALLLWLLDPDGPEKCPPAEVWLMVGCSRGADRLHDQVRRDSERSEAIFLRALDATELPPKRLEALRAHAPRMLRMRQQLLTDQAPRFTTDQRAKLQALFGDADAYLRRLEKRLLRGYRSQAIAGLAEVGGKKAKERLRGLIASGREDEVLKRNARAALRQLNKPGK